MDNDDDDSVSQRAKVPRSSDENNKSSQNSKIIDLGDIYRDGTTTIARILLRLFAVTGSLVEYF